MSGVVEKVLHLAASPGRVWRALTDPAELACWFPDETDLQPRQGSVGWFDWRKHGRYAVRLEAIEPERRLVWTWAREPGKALETVNRTTVEWTLEPGEDGGTTLRLRESGFADPSSREANDRGWDTELDELVDYLETDAVSAREKEE